MGCMCCRDREKSEDPDPRQLPLIVLYTDHSEIAVDHKPPENPGLESQTFRQLRRTKRNSVASYPDQIPEEEVTQRNTASEGSQGETKTQIRTVLGGAGNSYWLEKENHGLLTRAECRKTQKKCWIQTFEADGSEEKMQQLLLVQSLDHPNVLKLLDLFKSESHFYAVYEATEGGSAEELCTRSGGVSEQWTAAIMRQVLTALSHCHSKGLLLKTLSVKHVLFTETPTEEHINVKLLIPIGEEEDSCLAPELKSGAFIGPANDLWSCGVLISTLLAGECVILKMQASFTSREFRNAYRKWQEASQKAKSLALALMAINFEKRPTVEKCLQHPWLAATR